MRNVRMIFFILLALVVTSGVIPAQAQDDAFVLTIMHTNDAHAHHDPDGDDRGGVARQATVVKQIRAETEHSLLLDGGDRFTGSIFHSFYQGQDSAQVMNLLGYDAMALGSYEFTHGVDTLEQFISGLAFPAVVTNVDFSALPELDARIQPYIVVNFGEQRVGIMGVTQGDSRLRPIPELAFDTNYVRVVQSAADALLVDGVNKIVLISHLGYFNDLDLATQLAGIDVIVGGDSGTLLTNIAHESAEGPYPTVIQSAAGEPVLVVQAWLHNRVMGRLDVTFDAAGVIADWAGDAVFLTPDILDDPDMIALVEDLRAELPLFLDEAIGETQNYLEGEREVCRYAECSMGNLIADAIRAETGAQIAFHNGGAIRASIDPGVITVGDVYQVLPFSNTYLIFELSGADVLAALENGVSRVEATEGTGRFLQVSGLRFTWDGSQTAGRRIVSVEVLDEGGDYELLDPDELYTVATNDYLFVGGDDYGMFASNAGDAYDFGRTLDEIVRQYIEANSPIMFPATEGRIKRLDR